jgi:hypothetical protein
MVNYKATSKQIVYAAITAFNFDSVHKRLVKENLAYYTSQAKKTQPNIFQRLPKW